MHGQTQGQPSPVRTIETDHSSASTSRCLLHLVQPACQLVQALLSASDAVQFMRTSHSVSASLLAGYSFTEHVFSFNSGADLKRSLRFYERHDKRIVRLCLPADWNEPLVDTASGRSVLPHSLLALSLGDDSTQSQTRSAAHALDSVDSTGAQAEQWERQLAGQLRRWEENNSCDVWSVFQYGPSKGLFNQPIPPGTLPATLRFLQFGQEYNQPLQVGSIPDTVEVLQFGAAFNQPLQPGHLPASLTHLVFGVKYDQPLLPGVLPERLTQLHLGGRYNQVLLPGVLPPHLQYLHLGIGYSHPLAAGSIPATVTHLRLSDRFNRPLHSDSVPSSVLHLHLGDHFDQPLLRAALPTSLRELFISRRFNHQIEPGALPSQLQVLAFHQQASFNHVLQSGVLPASVRVVSFGEEYRQVLVDGGIGETVQWLRLPSRYAKSDLASTVSSRTRLVWWRQ